MTRVGKHVGKRDLPLRGTCRPHRERTYSLKEWNAQGRVRLDHGGSMQNRAVDEAREPRRPAPYSEHYSWFYDACIAVDGARALSREEHFVVFDSRGQRVVFDSRALAAKEAGTHV